MEPNNNPWKASRNLHNKPINNKNYKNSRKKDNNSNNSISFSKHSNNYHSETEKLGEKNKYGKNNSILITHIKKKIVKARIINPIIQILLSK